MVDQREGIFPELNGDRAEIRSVGDGSYAPEGATGFSPGFQPWVSTPGTVQ